MEENNKTDQSVGLQGKKKGSPKHKRLSAGIRKFIRGEKARLRRENSDPKEIERLIKKMYERFTPNS